MVFSLHWKLKKCKLNWNVIRFLWNSPCSEKDRDKEREKVMNRVNCNLKETFLGFCDSYIYKGLAFANDN